MFWLSSSVFSNAHFPGCFHPLTIHFNIEFEHVTFGLDKVRWLPGDICEIFSEIILQLLSLVAPFTNMV